MHCVYAFFLSFFLFSFITSGFSQCQDKYNGDEGLLTCGAHRNKDIKIPEQHVYPAGGKMFQLF